MRLDRAQRQIGGHRDLFVRQPLMDCQPKDTLLALVQRRHGFHGAPGLVDGRGEIYIVDPMVVVLAGNVAMKALLKGRETAITKAQGKLNTMKISGISFELEYDCMPIYHPAFILREEKVGKSGKYASDGKAMETRDHLRSLFDAVELTKQRYRRYEEEF